MSNNAGPDAPQLTPVISVVEPSGCDSHLYIIAALSSGAGEGTSSVTPASPSRPRYKHMSEAEIADCRENGLCFYCDQKFSLSHKCKGRFMLLMAEEEDQLPMWGGDPAVEDQGGSSSNPPSEEAQSAQISLNALFGSGASETLRVVGQIAHYPVQILVDGGSTHNIVQVKVASLLGLEQSLTSLLKVLVGSGEELRCTQICKGCNLQWPYVSGGSVCFGHVWIRCCIRGPVAQTTRPSFDGLSEFNNEFVHGPNYVELKGGDCPSLTPISLHQLQKFLKGSHEA